MPKSLALDIGCGSLRYDDDNTWITLDICKDAKPMVCGDVHHLPFKNSSFDIVRANHILEHVDDIVRVLNEVARVIKPSGRFHVTVPRFPNLASVVDPTHVRFFVDETFCYFENKARLPGLEHSFRRFAMQVVNDGPYQYVNWIGGVNA